MQAGSNETGNSDIDDTKFIQVTRFSLKKLLHSETCSSQ